MKNLITELNNDLQNELSQFGGVVIEAWDKMLMVFAPCRMPEYLLHRIEMQLYLDYDFEPSFMTSLECEVLDNAEEDAIIDESEKTTI